MDGRGVVDLHRWARSRIGVELEPGGAIGVVEVDRAGGVDVVSSACAWPGRRVDLDLGARVARCRRVEAVEAVAGGGRVSEPSATLSAAMPPASPPTVPPSEAPAAASPVPWASTSRGSASLVKACRARNSITSGPSAILTRFITPVTALMVKAILVAVATMGPRTGARVPRLARMAIAAGGGHDPGDAADDVEDVGGQVEDGDDALDGVGGDLVAARPPRRCSTRLDASAGLVPPLVGVPQPDPGHDRRR